MNEIGGIAQIFGRRPAVLGSIALFAIGSGVCGGAKSMTELIAGRSMYLEQFFVTCFH